MKKLLFNFLVAYEQPSKSSLRNKKNQPEFIFNFRYVVLTLACCFLFLGYQKVSAAAPKITWATVNPTTVTPATSTNLYQGQSTIVVYGLSATTNGNTNTVTGLTFATNQTVINYFLQSTGTIQLFYANNNANLTGGTNIGGTASVSGGTTIAFSGFSQAIPQNSTKYFYLVVSFNSTVGPVPATFTFTGTTPTGGTGTVNNTGSLSYNLCGAIATLTSLTTTASSFGLSVTPIALASTGYSVYGFSLTGVGTGSGTITSLTFTQSGGSTDADNLYYTTAYLYSSATNTYINGTTNTGPNLVSQVSADGTSTITFPTTNITVSSSLNKYYFIVLSNSLGDANSNPFALLYSSATVTNTAVTGSNQYGPAYTFSPPLPNFSYTTPNYFAIGTTIATPLSPTTNAGGGAVATGVTYGTGTVVETTTNGISNPWGMARDAAGNVYVADYAGNTAGAGSIVAYSTSGSSTPFITGLRGPLGIAFDSYGYAYVLLNAGSVVRYNSSGALQSTIITGLTTPRGITIDNNNNLFVSYNTQYIAEYTLFGGTATLANTATAPYTYYPVTGISVDPATGYVFADDNNNSGFGGYSLDYYNFTTSTVYVDINEGYTGYGIYLDGSSNIYEARTQNTDVPIYYGGTLQQTLTASFMNNRGLVTDNIGDLFVSDYTNNTVTEFKPKSGYYISGPLPPGLSFDTSTGAISGTPTTTYSGSFTVTGYNSAGPYTCTAFTINCGYKPAFTYPTPDNYAVSTTNISPTLSPTNTGGTPTSSYTVSPSLPGGLSIDPTTGIISGPPNAVAASATYTVSASNLYGTGTFPIVIAISTLPNFSYNTPNNYTVNVTPATPLSPTPNAGGGAVATGVSYGTGTVVETSANGLSNPWGMARDAAGNVYVADYAAGSAGAGSIVAYSTSGSSTPFITGLTGPLGIAFDSFGYVYVLTSGGSVIQYNSSGGAPNPIITGLTAPQGITIDNNNNLFVSYNNRTIGEYTTAGGNTKTLNALNNYYPTTGISTDPTTGYVYVDDNGASGDKIDYVNFTNNNLYIYGYTTYTGYGIYVDGSSNVYEARTGNDDVPIYYGGTLQQTLTASFSSNRGLVTDNKGDLFVSDYTNNTVTEFTPLTGYYISGTLPPGMTFDTSTGNIAGTPTANYSGTYTVTGYNAAGGFTSTPFTINCTTSYDWIGAGGNSNWSNINNWESKLVPGSTNTAYIGVNYTFSNQPTVNASAGVGAIVIGNSGGQAATLTVNNTYTLTVTGDITKQSDANSTLGYASTLAGNGTIKAVNLNVIANTAAASAYTETFASSIASLQLSGNVALTSSSGANAENAKFSVTGGVTTLTATGLLSTASATGSTSTFSLANGTLQVAHPTFLSDLSANCTNVTSFNNTGATIEYSGGAQTVYTDAAVTNLSNTFTYRNIKFSGNGIKTPTAGNLYVPGDFTNVLTLNDAADYVALTSIPVYFNGTTVAQNIYAGNGTGTIFKSLTFNGSKAVTIQSGNAYVASNGLLTMAGTSTLAVGAGGFLTLNADATGCAAIAPITSGTPISGNVNVQRYISGSRGYRLLSSPVYTGATGGNNVYSLNYLANNLYLTGSTTGTNGFAHSGNPTLYLYDETFTPLYTSFLNSNYIGIANLQTGTAPAYKMNANGGGISTTTGYTIPISNGYLCFFRGNGLTETTGQLTNPGFSAAAATVTATGTLNQGQITFKDWYTPGTTNLSTSKRLFNLVGNPYASAIDLNTIQSSGPTTTGIFATPLAGANGIESFIYELITTGSYKGQYGTWTAGGTSATAVNGAIQYVASGEGFFVRAHGTSTLVFNESAKATSTNANSFGIMARRMNVAALSPQTANPVLRLKMTADTTSAEETLIQFNPAASTTFVLNEDAPHQSGSGLVHLASRSSDSVAMAINTVPLLKSQTIPLNVYANNDGVYSISLAQAVPLPALYDMWLMDAYKKDSLDIKNNPTYSFDIANADTNSFGTRRLSLVIRQNPALMVHLLNFTASKQPTGDQVLWTTENEANYTNFTVQRSTDGGKTFATLDGFVSSALGTYTYLDKTPVMGANSYRLQMTDLNGAVTYSSVVTIMYANTNNQIATNGMLVYPNPTVGVVNLAINSNQAVTTGVSGSLQASYNIEIVNNLGSVIKTATSTSANWQTDVSALLPGTYFIQVTDANKHTVVGKTAFVRL